MDCTNHPGVEATKECWNCYRPFCGECLKDPLPKKDHYGNEILLCADCKKVRVIDNLEIGRHFTPGTCYRCGTPVREGIKICRRDAGLAPEIKKAGKGALWSLGLAVAAIITCGLTAIPGMIMGIIELKKIKRGEAPIEGKIVALSGTLLSAFVVAGFVIMLIVVVALSARA